MASSFVQAQLAPDSREALSPICAPARSGPLILDQLDLAMDLLWPFARRVFLMHSIDELPYCVIVIAVDVDVATVETSVADALWSVRMVRYEIDVTPHLFEYEFSGGDCTATNLILFVCSHRAHHGGREMERRTLVGGLLLNSGIVVVRCPGGARGWRDSEANEEAMWRLQNAHEFFPTADFARPADLLYQVGIVSQLALTACLVASGWTDEDCRRRIGQDLGKAHFHASAGGLQFHSESFARLMPLLSPYGRWRAPAAVDWRDLGAIDTDEVRLTVSRLLAAVRSHLDDADAKGARQ